MRDARKAMFNAMQALRDAHDRPRPDGTRLNYRSEIDALRAALAQQQAEPDSHPCTCHPDDDPPTPCPRRFALNECRQAALAPQPASPKDMEIYDRIAGSYFVSVAQQRQPLADLCSISTDGLLVHGDRSSIDRVKIALHDAATLPELRARLAALAQQQQQRQQQDDQPFRWISCSKRMPANGESVIVTYQTLDAAIVRAARWRDAKGVTGGAWWSDGAVLNEHVTHWRAWPLPPVDGGAT